MKKFAIIVIAAALFAHFSTEDVLGASQPPLEGQGGLGIEMPGERHKQMNAMRARRLAQELNLDESTVSKFFPAIDEYDRKKMVLEQEGISIMRDAKSLDPKQTDTDERAKEILERFEKNRSFLEEMRRERNEKIKNILTPLQMLRYFLFEERFYPQGVMP